jgi:hypothetical protein
MIRCYNVILPKFECHNLDFSLYYHFPPKTFTTFSLEKLSPEIYVCFGIGMSIVKQICDELNFDIE